MLVLREKGNCHILSCMFICTCFDELFSASIIIIRVFDMYLYHLFPDSPNQRSFRGPGGVGGLDLGGRAKICAR